MAVFTCKRCGGALEVKEGEHIAKCSYCGTIQTLPDLDDNKKENLYNRASQFRRNNEYDKAMALYNKILEEDPDDAEAHWGVILCKFGIEYIEDPISHELKPTINRMQMTSILADEDYKQVLANAYPAQRDIYINEANEIARIQKNILEISSKEEPFDVFICYKETDHRGMRTLDSVLAQDIYNNLVKENIKVFFSRITLEDKLGEAYEPYIFAALNSAKVMILVGTKPEHFNAIWVKNEWSRYLTLINNGENKTLIPAYRDMDPYDIPIELQHIQAQDMSKIGFMQDLVRGVKKIVGVDKLKNKTVVLDNNESIYNRANALLLEGNFKEANKCAERILDNDFESAKGYLLKLLVAYNVKNLKELEALDTDITTNDNYQKAYKYADKELKDSLNKIADKLKQVAEHKNELIYKDALAAQKTGELNKALQLFRDLGEFKDASKKKHEIETELLYQDIVLATKTASSKETIENVINKATLIIDYKNTQAIVKKLNRKLKGIVNRKKRITLSVVIIILAIALSVLMAYIIQDKIIPMNAAKDISQYLEAGDMLNAIKAAQQSNQYNLARNLENANKLIVDGLMRESNVYHDYIADNQKITIYYKIDDTIRNTDPFNTITDGEYYMEEFCGQKNASVRCVRVDGFSFIGWHTIDSKIALIDKTINLTLYVSAILSPHSYRIEYNFDGGTNNLNPTTYIYSQAIKLGYPMKLGYDFIGWTGTDLNEVTKDVTVPVNSVGERFYTAHWTPSKYSIILKDPKNSFEQTITTQYKESYSLPIPTNNDPALEFDGWYNENIKIENSGQWNYYEDMILTAKWKIRECNVTYKNIDLFDINVQYDCTPHYTFGGYSEKVNLNSYIDNPILTQFEQDGRMIYFAGWFKDKEYTTPFKFEGEFSKDLTIYAKYISCYTESRGFDYSNQHLYESSTFIGHNEDVLIALVDEEITIDVGNNEIDIYQFSEDNIDTPPKFLQSFVGKTTLEAKAGVGYILKLNSYYSKQLYKITRNPYKKSTAKVVSDNTSNLGCYSDKVSDTNKIKYNTEYSLFTPSREGYTFDGWYYKGEPIPMSGTWTYGDIELTARWIPLTYDITLDPNGGTLSQTSKKITFGTTVSLPEPSSNRVGYAFDGWYYNNIKVTNPWSIADNVTLIAKWVPIHYQVGYKDSQFDSYTIDILNQYNHDQIIRSYTGKINSQISIDNKLSDTEYPYYPPSHNGEKYVFGGYTLDKNNMKFFSYGTAIDKNLQLYPRWLHFTQNYDRHELFDESLPDDFQKVTYNRIYIPYYDDTVTLFVKQFENIVPNVKVYKYNNIYGNFDFNDSCKSLVGNITQNEPLTLNVKAGEIYYFQANYFQLKITHSKILTNKYLLVENDTNGLTYTSNYSEYVKYIYDEPYKLFTPHRQGYTFDGWFIGNVSDGNQLPMNGIWNKTESVILNAKWVPLEYNVKFNGNGADSIVEKDRKIKYGSGISLKPAIKEGYNFIGWFYKDINVSNNSNWTIPFDVTLVAKWSPKINNITLKNTTRKSVSVTYHNACINGDNIVKKYYVGDTIENIIRVTQDSSIFLGWYKEPEFLNKFDFNEDISSNLDLYPKYSYLSDTVLEETAYVEGFITYSCFKTEKAGLVIINVDSLTPQFTLMCKTDSSFVNQTSENGYMEFYSPGGEIYAIQNTSTNYGHYTTLTITGAGKIQSTSKVSLNPGEIESKYSTSDATYVVSYDQNYDLPTPVRDNYIFDGWYIDINQNNIYDSSDQLFTQSGVWKQDKDITLVAKWNAK